MTDTNWSAYLRECLDSTKFMALATRGPEGLWNHAVFYAYDQDLNVYFMSRTDSRHMQNILANAEAAVAIFSTNQDPTVSAQGLQIRGHATILSGADIQVAHAIYFQRAVPVHGLPSELIEFQSPDATWQFARITPDEIGYFDTRHFRGRQVVPKGVKL